LHCAAVANSGACVAALVAAGAQVDARCAEGETPLHCAAFHGASDACCSLLEAHADPAALTTADGDAALHLAALRGHAAAAVVLVRGGASTLQGNRDGCTPVEIAELTVCPVAFRCESQER
jgi:ankyrin repeat protein